MTQVRAFPIRLQPVAGEALDSWLEALAHRMHACMADVLAGVGLAEEQARRAHAWTVLLEPCEAARIAAATGVPQREIEMLSLARYDGTAVQIDRPNRRVSRYHLWGRGTGSRYCPECLAVSGGRWQLAWRLGWCFACPDHQRLLADSCPACERPQRQRPHPGYLVPQPGICSNPRSGSSGPTALRCAADLSQASTARLLSGHPALAAQQLLLEMIKSGTAAFGVYASEPQPTRAALADVRALANRILGHATREELGRIVPADLLATKDCTSTLLSQPQRRRYFTAPGSAAVAAVGVTAAITVLGAVDIPAAGTALRWLIEGPRRRGMEVTPTSLSDWGRGTSPVLTAVQLSALDPLMDPFHRLRYRTATSSPCRPAAGTAIADRRARCTPSLLWSAFSVRFALPDGFHQYLRRVMSCVLLTVGTNLQSQDAASRLGSVADPGSISRLLRKLKEDPHWAHIFEGIVRVADYLDTHSPPIDYQRRRELNYDGLLPDSTWSRLCRHAGIRPTNRKAAAARCVLFERISGLPASRAPFAIDDKSFLGALGSFPAYLTPELAAGLHNAALTFLQERHIDDEPATWHPPLTLLSNLDLPVPDPSHIDISKLHQQIRQCDDAPRGNSRARLQATADHLGTTIDVIRYVLEEHPAPRRPEADGQVFLRVRAALSEREFADLYLNQRLGLLEISRLVGTSRQTIRTLAREYGIDVRSNGRHSRATIGRAWLYEEYVTHQRTLKDLASQAGVSAATMSRLAHIHNIPVRVRGGGRCLPSLRDKANSAAAPAILRPALRDIRGWQRLERFEVAAACPTFRAAAEAIGLHFTTLQHHINRLERDLGSELLVRAQRGCPMKLTAFGAEVVCAIERARGGAQQSVGGATQLENATRVT